MPHPGQLASPSLLDLVIKCVYTSHLPPKSRNRQGMRSAHPTVTTACPSVVSTPTGNSCCKLTAVCVIDGVIQSTFRIELCSRTRRNALPRNVPKFAHNLWDIISHNARRSRPCPVGINPWLSRTCCAQNHEDCCAAIAPCQWSYLASLPGRRLPITSGTDVPGLVDLLVANEAVQGLCPFLDPSHNLFSEVGDLYNWRTDVISDYCREIALVWLCLCGV